MKIRLVAGASVVAVTLVVSCQEDGAGPTGIEKVQSKTSSLQTGTATITAPSLNHISLPTYPYSTLVRVEVDGLVDVQPEGWVSHQTDARGRDWNTSCVEGMKIVYDGGWYEWKPGGGCQPNQGYVPQASFTEYLLMGGTAYATWDGPVPASEATYDGGFGVTVTPVTGTGSLRADKYVLQGAEDVTFTATISPLSVGGYPVPHSITWRWVPDQPGGGNPAQNCGPWLVCTTTVSASGTMFADFVINGESSSKSVRIAVNSCPPTGNPWVDNPDLRGHLEQDLQNSNPSGPDQGRHEIPGSWYGSNATGEMSYHPITPSSADNCSNSASFPVIPESTLQVITHTHPYPPYTLLGWCGEDSIPPGYGYTEGPSREDSATVNAVSGQHGHGVQMCIIDVGNIYCLPPGTPVNGRLKFVKQPNGCYLLKP